MSRKIDSAVIDYACDAVRRGVLLKTLAQELHVSTDALSRHIRQRGVEIPKTGKKPFKYSLPKKEIVAMYQAGASEKAIAEKFGCSRTIIRPILVHAGIPLRSKSEASKLRYRNTTKEYRQALTAAAHEAVKGSITRKQALARAISREQSGNESHLGDGEAEIAQRLDELGIVYVRQKAVDIYNVDFAVGSVAVEVTCGTVKYRGGNTKENKRIKKLLECGYNPVCIEFRQKEAILRCLDDVVSHIQEARRCPPFGREYWVIRCQRKDSTVIRNDLGQFSSIPTPVQFFCKRNAVQL